MDRVAIAIKQAYRKAKTQRRGRKSTPNNVMDKKRISAQKKVTISAKKASTPSPPPLPSRKPIKVKSFTRDEIDGYWRMRRMTEEDHLLFAQKAAARTRAKTLKEEDHRRFEELLKQMLDDDDEMEKEEKTVGGGGGENKEPWIGIKDWWTKSKYAYLNQPAIKSMGENATNTSYIPQKTCFYYPPAMKHIIWSCSLDAQG